MSSVWVNISMERRSCWHWQGKPTYCEKTLSQCQISHRLDWDGNRDPAVTARRLTGEAWRGHNFCRHFSDLEDYIERFGSCLPVGRDSCRYGTRYGLDGPEIESRLGGEIFRTPPDRLWGPPSFLHNWYRVFPGGKTAGAWRWRPTPI